MAILSYPPRCGAIVPTRIVVLLAALLLTAPLAGARAASAPAATLGPLTIEQPWARATPGGAKVAAGYLTIKNAGDTPDRLMGATAEGAARVAPHAMSMANGVMSMRALPDGVVIPAHGSVTLKPGGIHLMMEDLKHPLKQGDSLPGTLIFDQAGSVPIVFSVEGIGALAPAGAPAPAKAPAMDMKMDMN